MKFLLSLVDGKERNGVNLMNARTYGLIMFDYLRRKKSHVRNMSINKRTRVVLIGSAIQI